MLPDSVVSSECFGALPYAVVHSFSSHDVELHGKLQSLEIFLHFQKERALCALF